LPRITEQLYAFGAWLAGPLGRAFGMYDTNPDQIVPGIFWVVMLLGFPLLMVLFARLTASGRYLGGRVLWYVPIFGHATRNRSMADVCEILAEAAESGLPLERAVQEIGQLEINASLRQRLTIWSALIDQGVPAVDAARRAGMPGLFVNLLASATAGDSPVALLRFLQSHYESGFSRLDYLLRSAAGPVAVVAIGLLVGWVVVSLFYPLVTLIDSLTGVIQPA